jgi:hypothetical protein
MALILKHAVLSVQISRADHAPLIALNETLVPTRVTDDPVLLVQSAMIVIPAGKADQTHNMATLRPGIIRTQDASLNDQKRNNLRATTNILMF